MLSVSDFVEVVAVGTGKPLATVRMIARRLIDDGILPKAVGARIPRVTPEHAASLLFAVMATPAIKDSSRTAAAFGALVHNGGSGEGTALQAVSSLLQRLPNDPLAFEWSIVVCTNFPQVVLKLKRPGYQEIHPSERTDYGNMYIPQGEDWMHWPSEDMKCFAVLSGIRLHAIACALISDE